MSKHKAKKQKSEDGDEKKALLQFVTQSSPIDGLPAFQIWPQASSTKQTEDNVPLGYLQPYRLQGRVEYRFMYGEHTDVSAEELQEIVAEIVRLRERLPSLDPWVNRIRGLERINPVFTYPLNLRVWLDEDALKSGGAGARPWSVAIHSNSNKSSPTNASGRTFEEALDLAIQALE